MMWYIVDKQERSVCMKRITRCDRGCGLYIPKRGWEDSYDAIQKLGRLEDVLEKYGCGRKTTFAVGSDVEAVAKDEIDDLADRLALLEQYKRLGSLLDIQKLIQNGKGEK